MLRITHLGQYWSAARREVRLLGCRDVSTGPDGRLDGAAVDLSDLVLLPGWRGELRRSSSFRSRPGALWTYAALPFPAVELVEQLEVRGLTVDEWAAAGIDAPPGARELSLALLDAPPDPDADHLVAPIMPRRAMAFGVTYRSSALERETEGRRGDYGYVYRAVKERSERPEIFVKGTSPEHFVGPGGRMALRRDLTNSEDMSGRRTPRAAAGCGIEPELAIAVHSSGRIWGYTLADDVSSNRLENETLLYLAQAKYFTGSLVLGPLILLSPEQDNPRLDIAARIFSARGELLFERATSSERISAPLSSLVRWVSSHLRLTPGEVISTGTDVVPDGRVKVLEEGMTVEIASPRIGVLRHGAAPLPEDADLNLDYSRLELEGEPGHGR
ncbi:MAG: fumarylacetoacetate hydrolase family protein [Planctomycetes bacterium]|nr:fumarylacetoacetate hydrolase family protein [Planctomycetota bacterium]